MRAITARILVFAVFPLIFGTVLLSAQTPAKPGAAPAKPVVKNKLDKGDFKVGFSPVTKSEDPKKDMPKDEKETFQEIATALNESMALPKDVYLNMDMCGEANAFYNSDTSEITICYELLDQYEREFKTISKSPDKVDAMVEDTLVQTLFHELGHCLIDVWDMPATGREEDAVDQLATILMLDGSKEGQDSAINAALEFEIASRTEKKANMIFWDEHSFSKTRFYDMLCLVYGSNPEKNAFLIGPSKLPEQRAGRCETEYKRAERAWLKLLAPYFQG
ncbi:DUF4344 domain-containing metallopeptidase [soil metagenome]